MSGRIVNCPYCGKFLPKRILEGVTQPIPEDVKCPRCGFQSVWRDGKTGIDSGSKQRYLCRICWYRFAVR